MDVKIGYQLYEDDAHEAKMEKMIKNAKGTTTETMGVRISGMKVKGGTNGPNPDNWMPLFRHTTQFIVHGTYITRHMDAVEARTISQMLSSHIFFLHLSTQAQKNHSVQS